jgi:NTP pyrophosphatase (non-canonical NTP hydrolase)
MCIDLENATKEELIEYIKRQKTVIEQDFANRRMLENIREWAHARNLIKGTTSSAQFEKYLEECGELGRALIERDAVKLKDAIGDCVVVLTILASQNQMKIEDCISAAYDEIKHRTGKMVDGVFVKDA